MRLTCSLVVFQEALLLERPSTVPCKSSTNWNRPRARSTVAVLPILAPTVAWRAISLFGPFCAKRNRIHCWAGGGIVADSDEEAEYRECETKIGRILEVLQTIN